MSSSASYTNFSQFPPDAEIHHLRGENASLKMENQKLISTSAAFFQEIRDAKVIIGQKEEEIAQKDKKLKESEEGLRQSILKARAQNNQHDLDMQELGFKNEAALKKIQTQLDEKDKELEKEKSKAWKEKRHYEKQSLEEKIAKDAEIAQLKAENLKLKTEKTICKQKGVDIDLLLSSGQTASPAATDSPAKPTVDSPGADDATPLLSAQAADPNRSSYQPDAGLDAAHHYATGWRRRPTQLKEGDGEDILGADSVEEELEGAWTYTLPAEHTALSAEGEAAVVKFGDEHYVMTMDWYEAAEEVGWVTEEQVSKDSIGMLNSPKYPTEEGEDIEGDFVVKA